MNPKMKAGSKELWVFLGYFVLLPVISLLLPVHFAFAQYHYELTPSIFVAEVYDDNIYLEFTDTTSDYITGVSPGLNLNILSPKMQLEIAYAPTFVWYAKEDGNNTVRHAGTLTFGRDLTQHLRFDLTDTYLFTEEPISETVVGAEGVGVRVNPHERYPYQINTGSASLSYLFGAENNLTAGYRNEFLDNKDENLDDFRIPDDRMLQTPFATLAYWFNIKNGIELNYELEKADFRRKDDFEPRDDYTGNFADIRYLYRFTQHTTGSVRYDYITRDFDGETEDYDLHGGSIGLEHAFSPDLSVSLAVGYLIQENEYSDDRTGPTYEASLMKTFARGSFTIGGGSGVDDRILDAPGQGLTRFWEGNAELEYQLLEPLRGYAGGSYRKNRDEDNTEWIDWRGNCGLEWAFLRWYSLSLDYTYFDRAYDVVDLGYTSYTVNRVMLMLNASRLFRW